MKNKYEIGEKVRVVNVFKNQSDQKTIFIVRRFREIGDFIFYDLQDEKTEEVWCGYCREDNIVPFAVEPKYKIGDVVTVMGLEYKVNGDYLRSMPSLCEGKCKECQYHKNYNILMPEKPIATGCWFNFDSLDELNAFVEKHREVKPEEPKYKFKVGDYVRVQGEKTIFTIMSFTRYNLANVYSLFDQKSYRHLYCIEDVIEPFNIEKHQEIHGETHQEVCKNEQFKLINKQLDKWYPKAPQGVEVERFDLTKLNFWYEAKQTAKKDCPKCLGTGITYHYPLLRLRTWSDGKCDCVREHEFLCCKEIQGCNDGALDFDVEKISGGWVKLMIRGKVVAEHKFENYEVQKDFFCSMPVRRIK